jgi:hypothetical protein
MPETAAPLLREVYILYFHCLTCGRRWHVGKPLSQEQAIHFGETLRDRDRGFRIEFCEPCWNDGNRDQISNFQFVKHPVH